MFMLYPISIHPTKYSPPRNGPFLYLAKNNSADKRVREKSTSSLLNSQRHTELVAEWRKFRACVFSADKR
jgi:hypothetical protein